MSTLNDRLEVGCARPNPSQTDGSPNVALFAKVNCYIRSGGLFETKRNAANACRHSVGLASSRISSLKFFRRVSRALNPFSTVTISQCHHGKSPIAALQRARSLRLVHEIRSEIIFQSSTAKGVFGSNLNRCVTNT
jgi:hypothetical protein